MERVELFDMIELDRRPWMRLAGAVGFLRSLEVEMEAAQEPARPQRPPEPPQRVTAEMLHQALQLIGLEFPPEQEKMMLPSVNRNLASYEAVRKMTIPLNTEPMFRFDPRLPGEKYPVPGPSRFFLSRKALAPKTRGSKTVEDLAFLTVTELAPLVRTRQVSSTDLTKMYLERLKKYSPKLLCVITMMEEQALAQARRADAEIKAGRYRGPLHGIPCGVKDLFATKGVPTTWGAEPYRDQVFDFDATVVEKLDKAGAVLLAKLSMGALAQGGLWFNGMTKTPWNIERTSSGSSAGSASATAAGLVGFALGTETLGSIVSPSTACGVTGLRPTFGRVSRYGAMALSWTMDKVGPICRSAEDCALVLRAIAGPDGKDKTVIPAPFDWLPDSPLAKLKVGYIKADFDRMQGQRKEVYDAALAVFAKLGVKMEPVSVSEMLNVPAWMIIGAEGAAQFDELTRSGGVNQLRGQAPSDWPNTFRTSRLIPAVEYIQTQRARGILMRQMHELMSKYDVIVSTSGQILTITNLTGHPQVVVPCGFTAGFQRREQGQQKAPAENGVRDNPAGLLFTARLFEEGKALRLAHAFQQATQWHTMHPKMDWA